MAKAAGVSRNTVVALEQGTANPKLSTLLEVTIALGVGLEVGVGALQIGPYSALARDLRRIEQVVHWWRVNSEAGVRNAG